jgi:hypothetical protein
MPQVDGLRHDQTGGLAPLTVAPLTRLASRTRCGR